MSCKTRQEWRSRLARQVLSQQREHHQVLAYAVAAAVAAQRSLARETGALREAQGWLVVGVRQCDLLEFLRSQRRCWAHSGSRTSTAGPVGTRCLRSLTWLDGHAEALAVRRLAGLDGGRRAAGEPQRRQAGRGEDPSDATPEGVVAADQRRVAVAVAFVSGFITIGRAFGVNVVRRAVTPIVP
jgi:hypothetical protein